MNSIKGDTINLVWDKTRIIDPVTIHRDDLYNTVQKFKVSKISFL